MTLDPRIKKLGSTVLNALQEIKGKDIIGFDLQNVQSYADLILVASGTNVRQVQTLADNIQKRVFQECQKHPLGTEGHENAQWILVDYGDVIIHLFLEETRGVYRLEDMWHTVDPLSESELETLLLDKPQKQSKQKPKKKAAPAKNKKSPQKPKALKPKSKTVKSKKVVVQGKKTKKSIKKLTKAVRRKK